MIISLRKRYLFSWNHFILLYIHFSLDLSQITPLSRTCHISYIGFCTEFFYRFIKFYRILYLFFARQSYFLRIFHIFYIIEVLDNIYFFVFVHDCSDMDISWPWYFNLPYKMVIFKIFAHFSQIEDWLAIYYWLSDHLETSLQVKLEQIC